VKNIRNIGRYIFGTGAASQVASLVDARRACDPWANPREVKHEYGVTPVKTLRRRRYDAIVLAVAHTHFKTMGIQAIRQLAKRKHVLFDIKCVFKASHVDGRL
jgi:UDP-N-acetyl-D-galactosamine dehydrogenase